MENEKIGIIIGNLEENLTANRAQIFDKSGGFIGSGYESLFIVQDKQSNIADKHVRISYEEGFFTISPVEDSLVFYNESFSPMQSGYDTIINKDDVFKIGLIKFHIIDSKEINEDMLKGKEEINKVKKDDHLDNIPLSPRGKAKIELEKDEIQNIIKDTTASLTLSTLEPSTNFMDDITKDDSSFNYQNMSKSLEKIFNAIKIERKNAKATGEVKTINIKDFENILSNIPLIQSTKLINTLALILINKELYSSIFEEIAEEDIFMEYLSQAIHANIQGSSDLFENILIKALENYQKNK